MAKFDNSRHMFGKKVDNYIVTKYNEEKAENVNYSGSLPTVSAVIIEPEEGRN